MASWMPWIIIIIIIIIICPLDSPEAGGEGSASVAVQEVDGEALEGVSVWHRPPHRVLELLVATGDAGAALQLVGRQRRGQQVGQVVVPDCQQLQVLEESSAPQRPHCAQ